MYETNPVVTRNGVSVELQPQKILKGKRAETVYLAPNVTPENLSTILSWIGASNLVGEIASLIKRKFQNIHFNAFDETTQQVNLERFLLDAANFTSAGMRLKEIVDKLEELQASLTKIIMGGKWQGAATTDNQPTAEDGSNLTEAGKLQAEMQKLNEQIVAYLQMKEDRQRKPKEEQETEPAVAV